MSLYIRFRSSICFALLLLTLNGHASSGDFRVVIDPGHGGIDTGASRNGIDESKITLKVGRFLEQMLREEGIKTLLTRHSDTFISLKKRAAKANNFKGDLFVSVHVNASPDHRAKGVEFYLQNQLPPSKESLFLASREDEVHNHEGEILVSNQDFQSSNSTVNTIIEDLERNHRIATSDQFVHLLYQTWQGRPKKRKSSVRQAPFYLVSHVNMPSTLVELGYVSHSSDAKTLTSRAAQLQMAKNLRDGILKFKELLDKQRK